MATPTHCTACSSALVPNTVTHSEQVGDEVFEIDDVPALVCLTCGETWFESEVMETIQGIVEMHRTRENGSNEIQ